MNVQIHVKGPYEARTMAGTKSYWDVFLFNIDNGTKFDLVPWNERCSLSKQEALHMANEMQTVTGFPICKFKIEKKTTYITTQEY